LTWPNKTPDYLSMLITRGYGTHLKSPLTTCQGKFVNKKVVKNLILSESQSDFAGGSDPTGYFYLL